MTSENRRGRRSQRGIVLVVTAILAVIMIGVLGLTADLGRAFVARNELRAFADAAAIAAAYRLDGTPAGLAAANSLATAGPGANKWKFGTAAVTGVTARFAQSFNGGYSASGSAPANSRFVSVSVSRPVPLFFMPAIAGMPQSMNVGATATAGQGVVTSPGPGLDPFSPDAVNPADTTNFGYAVGVEYDIKWAPPGQRNKVGGKCAGDIAANIDAGGGAADRGYIDLGQGNGNSALYDGIVNNDFGSNPVSLEIGDTIDTVTGNKHVGPALEDRVAQDTDTTHNTYASYTGNGRRVLKLAVNDGSAVGTVIGFASFLLPTNTQCMNNNNKACCAIYLGPAVLGGSGPAAGPGGNLYTVRLYR